MRPSQPILDAVAWTALASIAGVVIVSGAALRFGASSDQHAAAVAAVGAAGMAAVLVMGVRRRREVGRLRAAAEQILEANLPRSGAALSKAAVEGLGDGPFPRDLVSLRESLRELGHRVEVQIKEVAKKTRNLEALIDAMDEPLLATDNAERVLLCNKSAEAVFNAPPGGLVGRPVRELFTQSELLEMHAAARAGQTRRGRVRITTPLGKRSLQVSALPVPAAWGDGVFGAVMVLRDVTELDQAVQVKTDFVANASHELRTPVAAIRGAAETMQSAMADDPKMAERLRQMIQDHALRLEEMLRDLLDLSRLESPDLPIQVSPVALESLERSLRTLAQEICQERRLQLSIEFDAELAGMRTDEKMLLLILRNLVENATKFANEGTTVRVTGSVVEEVTRPHTLSPSAQPTNAVVRFEVIDRGVGIPLNLQERVFERYYQVDPARTGTGAGGPGSARRGTGLGLAIVKHAAKSLGGRAWLTSVWGQGTTVFAEIPVLLATEASPKSGSLT